MPEEKQTDDIEKVLSDLKSIEARKDTLIDDLLDDLLQLLQDGRDTSAY